MVYGVKQIHSADKQKNGLRHGQRRINEKQDPGSTPQPGQQPVFIKSGCFRHKQMYRPACHTGQEGNKHNNDSQSAQPVGDTPPEQNADRQCLNTFKGCHTIGGHGRHSFKKRRRQIQFPCHPVGHAGQGSAQNPGKCRRSDPFPVGYGLGELIEPAVMAQQIPNKIADKHTGKKNIGTAILKIHRHTPGYDVHAPQAYDHLRRQVGYNANIQADTSYQPRFFAQKSG